MDRLTVLCNSRGMFSVSINQSINQSVSFPFSPINAQSVAQAAAQLSSEYSAILLNEEVRRGFYIEAMTYMVDIYIH